MRKISFTIGGITVHSILRFNFAPIFAAIVIGCFSIFAAAQSNLDTSFGGGVTDADSQVYVSKGLGDGKIMVGGSFRLLNGVEKSYLSRLNADGSLDNTFNSGGSGPNNSVYEIIELTGGKFLIGGSFGTYNGAAKGGIARINPDGSVDPSFNADGLGVTGTVQTIALQPDGKILIAGSGIVSYNGITRYSVARLNGDGSLDTSFTSPFTSSQFVEEVDVQTDGKIIIGGSFNIGSPVKFDVARLNSNGTIDNSFNSSGIGSDGRGVYAVALQADGKILIGGGFQYYNNLYRPGVARLNANGTLDDTFTPSTNPGSGGGEYFNIQDDGKILVAGSFSVGLENYSLIRLNPNGSFDSSFVLNRTNSTGYHVTRQIDGKILLSGYFTSLNEENRRNFVRLNANGSLDSAFSPTFSTFSTVFGLAQQTDGKLVVGGTFNLANSTNRPNVARFNLDGSVDTTFNPGTGTYPDPLNSTNGVNDVAVQPDGKIIIAGNFGGYGGVAQRGIARINSDGSVDNSFESPFYNFLNVLIYDVLIQPDGKIIVAGTFTDNTLNLTSLYRLNSNGSFDYSFSGTVNSTVRVVNRLPDGKLLIGGSFTTYDGQSRGRLARLNANGSLDGSFTAGTGFNSTVLTLNIQPDGKILVGGSFTSFNGTTQNRFTRLNADGTADASFNPGSGASGSVYSIAAQSDGKIFIAGSFSSVNGFLTNRLARLNADGSTDSSFVSGFDNNDSRFFLRRIINQTDGKLLVGGTFKNYGGSVRNSLLRLTASAARRAAFDFDGDGRADQAVFRPTDKTWYLSRSTAGFTAVQFGNSADRIVPADYDGDGKTDVAVFRDGVWFWLNSSNGTYNSVTFGQAGDVSVPADYTGDGRAELGVYRDGNWFYLNLVNNQFQAVQFGGAGDKPVQADYDGDGKTDVAVFRAGVWYILKSAQGFSAVQFGTSGDTPVTGDFDGDGKADQAVFRNGTWYISGSLQGFSGVQFGTATDTPAAADYDGDGKTDIAVFRAGAWYAQRSAQGFGSVQFGSANDQPVPAAYLR